MKTNKIFLISLCLVFGFLTMVFIYFYQSKSIDEIDNKNIGRVLVFPNKDTLYISATSWGLAGNHEEIILSNQVISKNYVPNKETDYIFYTPEIYYKNSFDKLIIYVNESSVIKPKIFKTSIEIDIKGLKTSEQLNDYEVNHLKYGLIKLSVFDRKNANVPNYTDF
jgi:hypothetical protein